MVIGLNETMATECCARESRRLWGGDSDFSKDDGLGLTSGTAEPGRTGN